MEGIYSQVTINNVEQGQISRTWGRGVSPLDRLDATDYMVDERLEKDSPWVLADDVYSIFSNSTQQNLINSIAVENLFGDNLDKVRDYIIPDEIRTISVGRMTFFQWIHND